MPGNGEIGGGSCKLVFDINNKREVDKDDPKMPKKFKVEVEFPCGAVVVDEVDADDPKKKIRIYWPPRPRP